MVVIFLKVNGKALPYWRSSKSLKKWITILAPICNGLDVRRFMTPAKWLGVYWGWGGMGVISREKYLHHPVKTPLYHLKAYADLC